MPINNYSVCSKQYASLDNSGTAFLAFKKIPYLVKKYAAGKKTLDYGCGSGSSTLFLNEMGLEVDGVDISHAMLQEARQLNINASFKLIESTKLPYGDHFFDIAFSSFVLFEIPNKLELTNVLKEMYRVLKKGGLCICVTGSEALYSHTWLSLDVDFDQNKNLNSGDIAKVLLKDANLMVYDYYWTNQDYLEVINLSGFSILETLFPTGQDSDGYAWKDEKHAAPYVVYVLLK